MGHVGGTEGCYLARNLAPRHVQLSDNGTPLRIDRESFVPNDKLSKTISLILVSRTLRCPRQIGSKLLRHPYDLLQMLL